jgi:SAM-dependent methyltransferase
MAKKSDPDPSSASPATRSAAFSPDSFLGSLAKHQDWQTDIAAVAVRFNRDYRGEKPDVPNEVKAMPIYQEYAAGLLQSQLVSNFWELETPTKNQRCLDLGCGVSFLIYPWRDWEAYFYGQDISRVAQEILTARGPQLNSKLFKGVVLGAAHELDYEPGQFDLAIATGVSCYYPLAYWSDVLAAVKRVLKPGGFFLFDCLDDTNAKAENWAILETYLGTEVFLESAANWKKIIQAAGGKVVKTHPGELFTLYKVSF